ncbi:ABC transporter ATP-binding protein [Pseudooceanicola sp. CBS1P-1]|uniref:Spermidine/putrescine import ATP-binding protein PotA n=1 Tax=Pseudooceanicola albus TaxID=2692189 RepID=A0A6L7G7X8_9RHOB|nr:MULTISPECIES: ABC transporter ATP-binding protein [Pseudooceanicola]MBT9385931.1 ABC transporter ATP-binding protein [Pseudooceanicola endophyticus]MXN19648.1 polyamine ABC transporter ATP-binding protein [Pseudooceanicola albus]
MLDTTRPSEDDGTITLSGIGKSFGSFTAIEHIDLDIRGNEFFTLLGPSGCGKTTLLRMLAGFETPSRGEILLNGRDIARLAPNQRPINTVFQNYALFPHLSVAENIGFALKMRGKPRSEIERTVEEMLALVQLDGRGGQLITQLSGGQQQRVALARALAPRPAVLLLDEPLSALDQKLRKNMQIELKRLQKETGITFVFVTHDQEEALTMSDRIAVLSNGALRQVGTPHEIYNHPVDRFVADFIGETNLLEGRVVHEGAGRVEVALEGGVTVTAQADRPLAAGRAVTLAVRPENTALADPAPGQLCGKIDQIVYFGTDTHFHLTLDSGVPLVVRRQNRADGQMLPPVGARVGVTLESEATRILKD